MSQGEAHTHRMNRKGTMSSNRPAKVWTGPDLFLCTERRKAVIGKTPISDVRPLPTMPSEKVLGFRAPYLAYIAILESYLSETEQAGANERFEDECERQGWTRMILPAPSCVADLEDGQPQSSPLVG